MDLKQSCLALGTTLSLLAACGGKSSNTTSDNTSEETNSQRLQLVFQPEVTPPVESNTPDSFKEGFALARLAKTNPEAYRSRLAALHAMRLSNADACATNYTRGTTQYSGCVAAADVKDRYFSGEGPTDLATMTKNVDSRMEDIFRNTSSTYMPCFDEKNTAGGNYKASGEEKTYPAFAQYTISNTFTFADSSAYDSGLKGYLSCYSPLGLTPSGLNSWVAFGRKDGDYYINEGQEGGVGSLSKTSQNGDVEILFSVGTKPSTFPTTWTAEESVNSGLSGGLIHLKSFAETGVLELTTTGYGLSDAACSTHIATNGKILYVLRNSNDYGACSADDDGIGTTNTKTDTVRAYDATKIALEYCINVSDKAAVTAYDSLEPCADAGLSKTNLKLETLTRAIIKGYKALYMFSENPKTSINEVTFVPVSVDEVEGSDTKMIYLAVDTETNNLVETACNTATADKKDVTLSYKLDMATFLAEQVAIAESSPSKGDDFDAAKVKSKLLADIQAATGSNVGALKFTVGGSAGGVKWAAFDLAVALKIDGNAAGSGSYTETTDHAIGAQTQEISADLASLTETSVVTVTGTGHLTLGCSNPASTTAGTATLRLATPRLTFTVSK